MINNHFLNYQSETKKRLVDIGKNLNDYTTGSLLDYDYVLNHYKLIAVYLSRQDIDLNKQQINFIGKLENPVAIFFLIESKKSEKTTLNFSQNFFDIV